MKIRFVDRKDIVNELLDNMLEVGNLSLEQQDLLIGLTSEK